MQTFKIGFLVLTGLLLTGCSGFSGLREPLYDGKPIVADEEAIETYAQSREVVGEEKAYYFRYPFSEDIYEPSLPYPDNEPILLTDGTYTIGEELPAGRVSLLGNESVFTEENNEVHVGNMVIRDANDTIYFEQLFHSEYGELVAQVDFIEGHTLKIIGRDPEITLFYAEQFPKEPYILMNPPQLLINLERVEVQQPITQEEENQSVTLTAGIYEVGEHLEPGSYEIKGVSAPHNTELFHFREGVETRVYELVLDEKERPTDNEGEAADNNEQEVNAPVLELQAGDKLYPSLVHKLVLEKVDE